MPLHTLLPLSLELDSFYGAFNFSSMRALTIGSLWANTFERAPPRRARRCRSGSRRDRQAGGGGGGGGRSMTWFFRGQPTPPNVQGVNIFVTKRLSGKLLLR